MRRWRPRSLRGKLLLFSAATSLALGLGIGLTLLYVETQNATKEAVFDINNRYLEMQLILRDELREGHDRAGAAAAAAHIGRAFFPDRAVISGEITTPNGTVLAAKDKRAVGKVSDDAGEIRASVRKGKPIINFWALTGPGDLDGKRSISDLSVFDLRPKAQEFTAPVIVNGRAALAIHFYVSLERLTANLRRLAIFAFLLTIGIVVISGAVTFFWLDRLIYRRIQTLDEVAERITAGDTNLRAPVVNDDEFGELARRFNAMTDGLIFARFQADTDPLTGLFNYRHLQNHLAAQIVRAARYDRDLTVAMLDLDYFKNINDLYGHQTGDGILKMTAGFVRSELRQVDYMARYGGEEFVVIMPETGAEAAVKVMRRILAGFPENVYVERMGIKHPVFVSIGVADFPLCGEDAANLLAAADMALLLAKRRGRNQVAYSRALDQKAG